MMILGKYGKKKSTTKVNGTEKQNQIPVIDTVPVMIRTLRHFRRLQPVTASGSYSQESLTSRFTVFCNSSVFAIHSINQRIG
jgi:hypothetical protein